MQLHKDFLLIVSKFFMHILSWIFHWLLLSLSFLLLSSPFFDVSFQVSYYFNVYCALSGLCIILALLATTTTQLAGSLSRRRLHDQLVESVMRNSLHFFQSTPFGRIINRFSFDMSIIDKVWFWHEANTQKSMAIKFIAIHLIPICRFRKLPPPAKGFCNLFFCAHVLF